MSELLEKTEHLTRRARSQKQRLMTLEGVSLRGRLMLAPSPWCKATD